MDNHIGLESREVFQHIVFHPAANLIKSVDDGDDVEDDVENDVEDDNDTITRVVLMLLQHLLTHPFSTVSRSITDPSKSSTCN